MGRFAATLHSGLAFMLEHGFMSSPKGQMSYQMNLRQIRNAILESLYIGVLESLLRCKTNAQVFQQCYGRALTRASARKALDMEVESWAEIQKTDYGWDMLNTRAHKALRVNGVTLDSWVVNEGVKSYVAGLRRENWAYFLKGPEGAAMYKQQLANGDPKALDVASNALIFEAKQFNLPSASDPVNVLSRRRTIGEYVVSFPHVDLSSCKSYSSAFRDILAYDEGRDGFKKLTIRDGIENCCRFDADGLPLPGGPKDMFTQDDGSPVSYFAEMNDEGLPDQAISDWVRSACAGLEDEGQTARDLVVLKRLVSKLEDTPVAGEATTNYFKYVNAAYSSEDKGQFDDNGLPKLPARSADATFLAKDTDNALLKYDPSGRATYTPYGFGSAAGICALADPRLKEAFPTLHEEAVAAKRGLDAIVARVEAIMDDNLFARESSAPVYISSANEDARTRAAVFANLIHEHRPNVVLSKGATLQALGPDVTKNAEEAYPAVTTELLQNLFDPDMSATPEQSVKVIERKNYRVVVNPVVDIMKKHFSAIPAAEAKVLVFKMFAFRDNDNQNLKKIYDIVSNQIRKMDTYQLRVFLRGVISEAAATAALAEKQLGGPPAATPIRSQTQLTCSRKLQIFLAANGELGMGSNAETGGFASVAAMAGELYNDAKTSRFGGLLKRPQATTGDDNQIRGSRVVWSPPESVSKSDRLASASIAFSSVLEKCMAKALLGATVTKATLLRFVSANVVVPFNVIFARPFMTYDMSSGIALQAGADTGETLVGHADFQLGEFLHFRFFSKKSSTTRRVSY